MPSELSGGMKRRAALARLIVYRPKIILYDEPTTGLDPITSTIIEDLMKEIQRKSGVTSVIVTHQHSTIFRNGDIITMFYKGKIYATGTPDEIKNSNDELVRDFIEGKIR